jgi:hypothetical protein
MPGVRSIPARLKPRPGRDDASGMVVLAVEELRAWAAEALDAVRQRKPRRGGRRLPGGDAPFSPELAATIKRWLDLYGDPSSTARTPERERALRDAAEAARSPSEAGGLYSLAFAGWCWREVQPPQPDAAFAERGFESVCALLRVRDLPYEWRRAAFEYGVALHESETA